MLNLGERLGKVSVVADQYGSPTYTKDLAVVLADMITTNKFGTYHATNEGVCTWYEFASEIFKIAKMNVEVTPVSSSKYITKAKRPFNSRLSKDNLVENGFSKLPPWQDALVRFITELQVNFGE